MDNLSAFFMTYYRSQYEDLQSMKQLALAKLEVDLATGMKPCFGVFDDIEKRVCELETRIFNLKEKFQ